MTSADSFSSRVSLPVWDTAIAAFALARSRMRCLNSLCARAADWLLSKEIRRRGDWSVKRPNVEPSGWCFEFANEFYPDIDDTAMVLLALNQARATDAAKQQACEKRAVNWLLAMQGKDGGWAAFDVDNNWQFLSKVPFADHNAMLDPSCPDITGRVIEALVPVGLQAETILRSARASNICSIPRKRMEAGMAAGASIIFTARFSRLRGLQAAGVSDREAPDSARARMDSRLSECAMAAGAKAAPATTTIPSRPGRARHRKPHGRFSGCWPAAMSAASVSTRAVEYLVESQRPDGTWDEDYATGTGFPQGLLFGLY